MKSFPQSTPAQKHAVRIAEKLFNNAFPAILTFRRRKEWAESLGEGRFQPR
jgi:hypothetical protein